MLFSSTFAIFINAIQKIYIISKKKELKGLNKNKFFYIESTSEFITISKYESKRQFFSVKFTKVIY